MAKIQKSEGYYEDANGIEHGPFRVTLADKLQYEKTAKARGWEAEATPFTTTTFLAWHAAKRSGAPVPSFEEFIATVNDAVVLETTEVELEETPFPAGDDH